MNYSNMSPIKKGEQTHIQRKFRQWHKYWINCKDPSKRDKYFKEVCIMGEIFEKELQRQRE